jgi:hypothetical protein
MTWAESLPHATHVTLFADDDSMRPMHLKHLWQAFSLSSDVAFAYTCGVSMDRVIPREGIEYENPSAAKFVRS